MPLRFSIALVLSLVCPVVPAWADYHAGIAANNRGDYATALREWRPLAEQGHAVAQYSLGLLYANGQGVPKDDAQARQWYEKAAAQGSRYVQGWLGLIYANGRGMPQDLVQAHLWLSMAAAQGNKMARQERNKVIMKMTPAQVAEAQRLAQEWE